MVDEFEFDGDDDDGGGEDDDGDGGGDEFRVFMSGCVIDVL